MLGSPLLAAGIRMRSRNNEMCCTCVELQQVSGLPSIRFFFPDVLSSVVLTLVKSLALVSIYTIVPDELKLRCCIEQLHLTLSRVC